MTAGTPTTQQPKLALALGGGAVRGAAHFGVLHALELEGLEVHAIAGTSSGAIVGTLFALGKFGKDSKLEIHKLISAIGAEAYDDLQHLFFKDHTHENLFERLRTITGFERALRSAIRTPGLSSLEPLRANLETLLGGAEFSDLRIPFGVVTVDLISGEKVVLREGRLLEAVLASSAVPGVFPPVELGGRLLADGHVLDNVPAEVARGLIDGPSVVLAVDVGTTLESQTAPKNAFDVVNRAAEISREHLRRASVAQADLLIHIGNEVQAKNFEHTRARDLFEAGLERGHEIAPQVRAALEALRPKPESVKPELQPKQELLRSRETSRFGLDWRTIFARNQVQHEKNSDTLKA
jgi:NTE family protein